jgi:hypothetical protein
MCLPTLCPVTALPPRFRSLWPAKALLQVAVLLNRFECAGDPWRQSTGSVCFLRRPLFTARTSPAPQQQPPFSGALLLPSAQNNPFACLHNASLFRPSLRLWYVSIPTQVSD